MNAKQIKRIVTATQSARIPLVHIFAHVYLDSLEMAKLVVPVCFNLIVFSLAYLITVIF